MENPSTYNSTVQNSAYFKCCNCFLSTLEEKSDLSGFCRKFNAYWCALIRNYYRGNCHQVKTTVATYSLMAGPAKALHQLTLSTLHGLVRVLSSDCFENRAGMVSQVCCCVCKSFLQPGAEAR